MLNNFFLTLCAATALTFAPISASALNISVQTFSTGSKLTDARNAHATELAKLAISVTEDFETGFTNGQIGANATATLDTAVGTFTTLGGTGTGSSPVGTDGQNDGQNEGKNIAIRKGDGDIDNKRDANSQNDGGRFNTTASPTDHGYLDSNDTDGIQWTVADSTTLDFMFDRLLFNLVDVADAGRRLTIFATDEDGVETEFGDIITGQSGSTINTVLISFDTRVAAATVKFDKGSTNDGFSIDDATVGAVPLPAAAWLLMFASGGLIAAKRRSARRA